jgi:hypothetical protein
MPEQTRERSFDELAKGLAGGTVSRRKALRLMGAALVGGALASFPGAAWAAKGGGGGKSACAKYCKTLFGGDTAAQAECTAQGTKGTGPCFACTPGVGPGPGFTPNCTTPKTQFNSSTCQCECPATTCGTNETLNPSTCLCEPRPIKLHCVCNDGPQGHWCLEEGFCPPESAQIDLCDGLCIPFGGVASTSCQSGDFC